LPTHANRFYNDMEGNVLMVENDIGDMRRQG